MTNGQSMDVSIPPLLYIHEQAHPVGQEQNHDKKTKNNNNNNNNNNPYDYDDMESLSSSTWNCDDSNDENWRITTAPAVEENAKQCRVHFASSLHETHTYPSPLCSSLRDDDVDDDKVDNKIINEEEQKRSLWFSGQELEEIRLGVREKVHRLDHSCQNYCEIHHENDDDNDTWRGLEGFTLRGRLRRAFLRKRMHQLIVEQQEISAQSHPTDNDSMSQQRQQPQGDSMKRFCSWSQQYSRVSAWDAWELAQQDAHVAAAYQQNQTVPFKCFGTSTWRLLSSHHDYDNDDDDDCTLDTEDDDDYNYYDEDEDDDDDEVAFFPSRPLAQLCTPYFGWKSLSPTRCAYSVLSCAFPCQSRHRRPTQ